MPVKFTPQKRQKKSLLVCLPIMAIFWCSVSLAAQDFLGVWHVVLANAADGDPRRTLTVSEKNAKLACTFDVTGAAIPAEAKCVITGSAIEITIADGSFIRLTRSRDSLQGMLAIKATPNPMRIRMTRAEPDSPAGGKASGSR